ncbi:MAG: lamin tail domain-containing protein, partial [Patescibacteria group bacterium]|nr:lamin tail domain-containing protein [Patescibacteria group bacterium]
PDLISPTNNSYVNTSGLVMNWTDVTDDISNPVYYIYQNADNPGFSPLAYESGHLSNSNIPAPGMPDGIYWWRVKACDAIDNCSVWSEIWKVTVDNIAPMTTLSFSGKTINEKVLNGGFEFGWTDWQKQGEVNIIPADIYTAPYAGSKMVKIGHTTDDGSEIWENKLTQQIQPGAKNLSFYYNFFSYDVGTFDDPGMVVRLNDYNVFYLSASDIDNGASPNSSGWTQLSFDISQIPDPVLEIIFYSGNTNDELNQSWVYIDDVSTAEAVANNGSFTLTANESAQTYYSLGGGSSWLPGNSFNLSTITGVVDLLYYSVDAAGNIEGINTRRLVKDTQKPDAIDDLFAFATSKQTIDLTWTVPDDITVYDLRYSQSMILDETDFSAATAVLNPPAPRLAGEFQSFTVSGLNSNTTYYFALKSADAALNWSEISNVSSDITLDPTDPLSDPDINPGDVVINELMWMGSSGSTADEFLELRNMTDQAIPLKNWTVAGVTIPDGKIIPAHGYFLITNYAPTDSNSKLNDSLVPDWSTTSLTLYNSDAQYLLQDSFGVTIDTADNGIGQPAAGQYDAGSNIYYSMERDDTPGDGAQAGSWHTIFDDSALMHSYWDLDAVEKGTPGAPNLSQPAPIITQSKPTPEPTPEPISEPITATDSATPSASIISLPEIATESAVIIESP